MEMTATIDGKVNVVTEASVMRHLKLEDSDGISILPTEIFEQLALMGVKYQQSQLSPITHLHMLHQPHHHIFHHHLGVLSDRKLRHGGADTTVTSLDAGQGSGNIDKTPSMPHDSLIPRVDTLRSDDSSMTLQELTILCTTLSQKVESLEADLKQTKKVYDAAYTKLIMKVKKLEKTIKRSQASRKAKIIVSDEEVDLKDPSKREKRNVQTYTRRRAISTSSGGVSTASKMISIAEESVSTAGASMPVSTTGMVDKGKGIMQESKSDVTKTKRQQEQEQERLGHEAAVRLQEEFDEEERQRIARVHEAA
nr:hypothetical protein [Tanacetum cinerariifolium]